MTGKRGVRRGQWAALGRLSWTRHNFLPSHTPPPILYCIGLRAGRQTPSLVLGPQKAGWLLATLPGLALLGSSFAMSALG